MMNLSTAPAARSTWRYLSAYSGKSAPVQWRSRFASTSIEHHRRPTLPEASLIPRPKCEYTLAKHWIFDNGDKPLRFAICQVNAILNSVGTVDL
jgi:hypothetical protein